MHKYKFLIFIGLIFFAKSNAQNFDLQWSPIIEKESKKASIYDIDYLDFDGKYYYFVFQQRSKKRYVPFLNKFDKDLNLVSSTQIDMHYDEKNELNYLGKLVLDGNFYILSSYYNNSKDKNYGFIVPLTKDGQLEIKALTKVDEMPQEKKRSYGFFEVSESEDKSKILLSRLNPYEKNEQEKYALKVLDKSLNIIWEQEVSLPFKDKNFSINDYNVDNEGNVYMQGKLYEGKNDTKTTKDDYAYKIYMYDSKGKVKTYDIDIKDKLPIDIVLKFSDKALHCTGLYSDYETRSASGVFHIDLDKDSGKESHEYTEDFSDDLKDEYRTAKQIKKGKNDDQGLPSFEVRDLYVNSKGEKYLIAEQYKFWVETVSYYNGKSWSYRYVYHYLYGDILVTKFNEKGIVDWITRIPKYQHTTNDGGYYSGYTSKIYDDGNKIDFFFSELLDKKEAGSKKSEERYTTKVVTIDKRGDLDEKRMFNVADEQTIFRPKKSVELNDKETMILGDRKKDFKLGIVTY